MRQMAVFWITALACCVTAQSQTAPEESLEALPEEVLVTGEFPGPGMWKVTRADDPEQHTLWILGNPPPLPKKMKWKSKDVEAVVVGSQEILLGSSVNVKPDEKIGFFKGLGLLPAALGARKNPEAAKLKDIVEPDTYARWLVQKNMYLGKRNGIESWRPIFAGMELREEAFEDLKLRESGLVWARVDKLAKQHKVKTTTPTIDFSIKTKEIKSKLKQFAKEPLADEQCFETTLRLVETISDRQSMEARATAWATGDLQTLIAFAPLPNPNIACQAAIMSSQIASDIVPNDIDAQLKAAWLAAAERSLANNRSTFAFMSIAELTTSDGLLAALRGKGYTVEEPQRD